VCQFFLRGRCQRQKCEFRHPADVEKERDKRPNGSDRSSASIRETCKFYISTGCKFGANCHFKHIGRERRRSRSRSRERRYRSDSDEDRRGDSSDEEYERRKIDKRKREEREKEYQRRKLRLDEKSKDLKAKENKSVRERSEKAHEKRSVLLKQPYTKKSRSRTRSKSPPRKGKADVANVAKPLVTCTDQQESIKTSPSKPPSSPTSSPKSESRCSKCGQKVVKRRATS